MSCFSFSTYPSQIKIIIITIVTIKSGVNFSSWALLFVFIREKARGRAEATTCARSSGQYNPTYAIKLHLLVVILNLPKDTGVKRWCTTRGLREGVVRWIYVCDTWEFLNRFNMCSSLRMDSYLSGLLFFACLAKYGKICLIGYGIREFCKGKYRMHEKNLE